MCDYEHGEMGRVEENKDRPWTNLGEEEPVGILLLPDSPQTMRYATEHQQSPSGVVCTEYGSSSESSSSKGSTSSDSPTQVAYQWWSPIRLWGSKSIRRLPTFPVAGVLKLRKKDSKGSHVPQHEGATSDPGSSPVTHSWKSFSISELESATNNFSRENIIGKGGYAEVYKGLLEDGQLIAIKKLTHGTIEEQSSNFLSELGVIVHVNHPNIAKLIGFCVEQGMHLVLQFSPRGSLASLLHDSKEKVAWCERYKIAIGTAQGLEYLHEKCPRRIIHRDIKAANVLLTENFEAQICDFGLAKWLPDQWSHHNMLSFEGTFGYLAPEYIRHGIVDEKTDVFAFGVLLLELITGRPALDSSMKSLVIWAKPLLETSDFKKLVDSSLGDAYDHIQLDRMACAASRCLQDSALLRPRMSQVLKILRDKEYSSKPAEPQERKIMQRTFSESDFDAEDYTTTKYLNDLKSHKQLALDF